MAERWPADGLIGCIYTPAPNRVCEDLRALGAQLAETTARTCDDHGDSGDNGDDDYDDYGRSKSLPNAVLCEIQLTSQFVLAVPVQACILPLGIV